MSNTSLHLRNSKTTFQLLDQLTQELYKPVNFGRF
jgi:hypothetical protein